MERFELEPGLKDEIRARVLGENELARIDSAVTASQLLDKSAICVEAALLFLQFGDFGLLFLDELKVTCLLLGEALHPHIAWVGRHHAGRDDADKQHDEYEPRESVN